MKTSFLKAGITALALTAFFGTNAAIAQIAAPIDPSFEVFRIRCQIDIDIDPATGFEEPKVQIQGKARADLLDGYLVTLKVENLDDPAQFSSTAATVFELGSASVDWDTFPDPDDLDPVTVIPGNFVADGQVIRITAQVTSTLQTVSDTAECAVKKSAQFKQQTQNVCKLKDFLRFKCKSGDTLPDGTTMP
jgi:hypothetical protein